MFCFWEQRRKYKKRMSSFFCWLCFDAGGGEFVAFFSFFNSYRVCGCCVGFCWLVFAIKIDRFLLCCHSLHFRLDCKKSLLMKLFACNIKTWSISFMQVVSVSVSSDHKDMSILKPWEAKTIWKKCPLKLLILNPYKKKVISEIPFIYWSFVSRVNPCI